MKKNLNVTEHLKKIEINEKRYSVLGQEDSLKKISFPYINISIQNNFNKNKNRILRSVY